MNRTPGSIYFTLFGIPVCISPFSWLILALLGEGRHLQDASELQGVLIFVVVGMVVLLVHEFGHALTCRALGGKPHAIIVEGLGAVTHSTPPRKRWGYFLMVLAGPLATLIPALAGGLILAAQLGVTPMGALSYMFCSTLPFIEPSVGAIETFLALRAADLSPYLLQLYNTTFAISIWWCIFNLLPILPLDGGHLLATLCPNRRIVCLTGMGLSLGMVVWACTFGGIFLIMLFGYFAYINYQLLGQSE